MENKIWELLKENGALLKVKKGTPVTGAESRFSPDTLYFLAEGTIALTTLTKNGEEKVYLYFHAPRIIGFSRHLIDTREQVVAGPEFSNVARTDCTLYQHTFSGFLKLLNHNPELNYLFIKTIAINCSDALSHFHFVQEESAIVRLCHLLLEVSCPCGNKMVVPKFYSHTELARYLGCHPITVSRIMPRLRKEGYISRGPQGIVIENPEGLVRIIETESKFKY